MRDSGLAYYDDNIDKELVASKGLREEHILATNIEECKTNDPNTVPKYGKNYKLKTIIEVSEPVGRDNQRDLKDCKYILNVYGPSRYDLTKVAIVTQYPAAVNQFAKHTTAPHPCSYV